VAIRRDASRAKSKKAKRFSIPCPEYTLCYLPTYLPAYQERKPSGAMPSGRRLASGVRSRRVQVPPFSSGLSPSHPSYLLRCGVFCVTPTPKAVRSYDIFLSNKPKQQHKAEEEAETTTGGARMSEQGGYCTPVCLHVEVGTRFTDQLEPSGQAVSEWKVSYLHQVIQSRISWWELGVSLTCHRRLLQQPATDARSKAL